MAVCAQVAGRAPAPARGSGARREEVSRTGKKKTQRARAERACRSELAGSDTLVLHVTASQREKKDRATFRKQRLQERQKALQVAKLCAVKTSWIIIARKNS